MNLTRFIILNLAGAGACLASFIFGQASWVFENDPTRMTYLITIIFLIGLACVPIQRWSSVLFVSRILIILGLIGTVIGIKIALSGIEMENASTPEGAAQNVALLQSGLGTALNTTLLGAIGSLWLMINKHLLYSDPNDILELTEVVSEPDERDG